MTIRAKFRCNSITNNGYNQSANLTAVYGSGGENADYSKATPSGTLSISIDNEIKAAGFFEPMNEYYLTFEKAE
jgi:hypothetical protein